MSDFLPISFSEHARRVMRARGVGVAEVFDVLTGADVVEVTTKGERYARGTLTVVTARERGRRIVVTVLLRSRDPWTDEDARHRASA